MCPSNVRPLCYTRTWLIRRKHRLTFRSVVPNNNSLLDTVAVSLTNLLTWIQDCGCFPLGNRRIQLFWFGRHRSGCMRQSLGPALAL